MRSNHIWTDEKCSSINAWMEDNETSLAAAAKHFKVSYSALSQGMCKWRKAQRKDRVNLKNQIVRRVTKAVSLPRVTPEQVMDQRPREPFVPVVMVPMSALQSFLGSAYAANK